MYYPSRAERDKCRSTGRAVTGHIAAKERAGAMQDIAARPVAPQGFCNSSPVIVLSVAVSRQ